MRTVCFYFYKNSIQEFKTQEFKRCITVNCFKPQEQFICPRIVESLHSSTRYEIEMDKDIWTWFLAIIKTYM